MQTCPHGSATPRHCMYCLAAQLDHEKAELGRLRRIALGLEAPAPPALEPEDVPLPPRKERGDAD
jgi:hypothetical protein